MEANVQRIEREKNIVRRLIAHLAALGFDVQRVNDGEENVKCTTTEEAMETIFSVDESTLYVKHRDSEKRYGIYFVLGNDEDIISDCAYPDPDPDGFNAAMDAFDPCPVRVVDVLQVALEAVDGKGIKVDAVYELGADHLSADVVGADGRKFHVEIKITEVPK